MKCKNCGMDNPEGMPICMFCGIPLEQPQQSEKREKITEEYHPDKDVMPDVVKNEEVVVQPLFSENPGHNEKEEVRYNENNTVIPSGFVHPDYRQSFQMENTNQSNESKSNPDFGKKIQDSENNETTVKKEQLVKKEVISKNNPENNFFGSDLKNQEHESETLGLSKRELKKKKKAEKKKKKSTDVEDGEVERADGYVINNDRYYDNVKPEAIENVKKNPKTLAAKALIIVALIIIIGLVLIYYLG